MPGHEVDVGLGVRAVTLSAFALAIAARSLGVGCRGAGAPWALASGARIVIAATTTISAARRRFSTAFMFRPPATYFEADI